MIVESVLIVVWIIGMFLYFTIWIEWINRKPVHEDAMSLTLGMLFWPVCFWWLCDKRIKEINNEI